MTHTLLFLRAIIRYGIISPCAGKNWRQCFNSPDGVHTAFWFNVRSGSTKTVMSQ